MYGRFTIRYTWTEYHEALSILPASAKGRNDPPRYNVAPTQTVGYVHASNDATSVTDGRWWLVPHWAKELSSKWPVFNARSEDAHNKPAFRDAYKKGRCLIPADGYYEWTKNAEDGKKDLHYIHLPVFESFAFAGLCTYNKQLDIHSCTILTVAAVPEIEHLHKRMPIILDPKNFDAWLNADTSVDDARALLNDNRDHELVSYRVDRAVGSSRIEGSQLIEPIS